MRLLAALFLFSPGIAQACSCIGPAPVCQSFTQNELIFRGTVVSLSVDSYIVKADFVVAETFRGEARQQVSIYTHEQSSACGFDFEKGLEYVVYANPDHAAGNLSTTKCSRTHRIEPGAADADVAWMRQYPTAPPTATIFGREFLQSDFPFPKLTLKIRGPENHDLTTGADGHFSVAGLLPGEYTVSAAAPSGLLTDGPHTVKIAPKGCAEIIWFIASDTHVRGRLLRPDGSPFADMQLYLLRLEPGEPDGYPRGMMDSDPDGRFDFAGVPPGDYYLLANPLGPVPARPWSQVFYKGSEKRESATLLHLEPAHSLDNIEITMTPQLKPVTVQAKFLLADGSPARNASVMAYDVDHLGSGEPPSAQTGADGEATLTLFAGREYYVMAFAGSGCIEPFKFKAKAGLVLEPPAVKPGLRACHPARH